jgi:hypothetical protein
MDAPSGQRFRVQFDRDGAPSKKKRVWYAFGGILICLVGGAMLVLPGPGVVVILLGFAFMGRGFRFFASLMDNIEIRAMRIWRWVEKKGPIGKILTVAFLLSGTVAATLFGLYLNNHYHFV